MSYSKNPQAPLFVSEGVSVTYTSEVYDGETLDTEVELTGLFCIAGRDRQRFADALQALIDEYRI